MGSQSRPIHRDLTPPSGSPESDEIELSLFGPGYGECAVIHIGNGKWVIVDSCVNRDSQPAALAYLRSIGSDPSEAVRLIVATHWHDDHIRGMADMVEVCGNAAFCCASALHKNEFLAAVGALENRPATEAGSGLREIYRVFSLLAGRSSPSKYAISQRLILDQDGCKIWALSPSDRAFEAFLQQIGRLIPKEKEAKRRVPSLTPNEVAVALSIKVSKTAILLGADLESKGWLEIFGTYEQFDCKASAFKVPHHGSRNAHEDRVWHEMLQRNPIAALTPWRRGGRELPTKTDIHRILSFTGMAYVTASKEDVRGKSIRRKDKAVERTLRESGAKIRAVGVSSGMIRLRKKADSLADWNIETLGSACRLADY